MFDIFAGYNKRKFSDTRCSCRTANVGTFYSQKTKNEDTAAKNACFESKPKEENKNIESKSETSA